MARLPKLPKWPKGLKRRLNRKAKLDARKKEIAKRKSDITAARRKLGIV